MELGILVQQSEGIRVLSTRFVFLRKRDESGEVIRYKVRLVVRGFLQGNVDQAFAPLSTLQRFVPASL